NRERAAAMHRMTELVIEPVTPAIGSIVREIDLSDARTLSRIGERLRQLLLERQVIFFRDQRLEPEAQLALARLFGEVRPVASTFPAHPESAYVEILQSAGRRTGTDIWHADLTWQREPPRGACLFAVNVPPCGGDTLWASMTAAYDSLDEKRQAYLGGLAAVHDWEGPEILAGLRARPDSEASYREMRLNYPPIEHPVIAVHPETGRKLVYVNAMYTTRIVGVSRSESAAIIGVLAGLATVPEWQARFRWTPGSVAIWDNRAVQHYAVNDYHPFPRRMHRVAIF
ncbi:MAG: TauD/TfdA dioxygenase family protein, partial [Stellaceae bacterium]